MFDELRSHYYGDEAFGLSGGLHNGKYVLTAHRPAHNRFMRITHADAEILARRKMGSDGKLGKLITPQGVGRKHPLEFLVPIDFGTLEGDLRVTEIMAGFVKGGMYDFEAGARDIRGRIERRDRKRLARK